MSLKQINTTHFGSNTLFHIPIHTYEYGKQMCNTLYRKMMMKCHISSNLCLDLILALKLSLKGQSASSLKRIVSDNNVNCRLSRPDRNTNISLKECCLSLHLSLDFHLSVSLSLFIFPSDTHTIQTQLHVKLVFGSRSKALALVNAT